MAALLLSFGRLQGLEHVCRLAEQRSRLKSRSTCQSFGKFSGRHQRVRRSPIPIVSPACRIRWCFAHELHHAPYPAESPVLFERATAKILELLKALKAREGDRAKRLFQFLNEAGARALRMHIGRVLEIAESSADKYTYENRICRAVRRPD